MAFSTKVGSFTIPGSTGNQAITGVGFQPKVILFWANRRTADGGSSTTGTSADMSMLVLGMTDGTASVALFDSDDFSSGDPFISTTRCIYNEHVNIISYQASLVSLDSDGFTINFTTVQSGVVINWLALGGTDITGAKIISHSLGTSTGNVAFTGAGFAPDSIIMIGGVRLPGGSSFQGCGGLGLLSSTSSRNGVTSNYGDSTSTTQGVTGFTSNAARYQRTNQLYVETFSDVKRYEGDIASLDSDGFTINLTTAPTASPSTALALCLKGIQMKAGSITQRSTTGSQATTGVGFHPSAILFTSAGKAPGTTIVSGSPGISWIIGGTDGTNQSTITKCSFNNGVGYMGRSHCIAAMADSAATTPAMSATITSLDSDGFTLNYDVADAAGREIMYMAFGASGTTPPPTTIPTDAIVPHISGIGAA